MEIYFAGGCFWGMERMFQSIVGVTGTTCGYANEGGRETVHVIYDPERVKLEQLLKGFFYVIDPTIENQQGPDRGEQYQTGIYYTDEESKKIVLSYVEEERKKHPVFVVEYEPLVSFVPAEEFHQNYLVKHPDGYCHIRPYVFQRINEIISLHPVETIYEKPAEKELREKLTNIQYEVTQNAATERPFTGEYWDHFEKGIYVDVTTGQPLFSSLDKFPSSCGWPGFSAPLTEENVVFTVDRSFQMVRTEVRSQGGNAHLGHVFYGEPESPNGVRYCINSASLRFVPYDQMAEEGYENWMSIFQ